MVRALLRLAHGVDVRHVERERHARAVSRGAEREVVPAAAGAQDVILTPGNYGLDFLRSHALVRRDVPVVKCANFIGAAL